MYVCVFVYLQLSLYDGCKNGVCPIWKDAPQYSKCGTDEKPGAQGALNLRWIMSWMIQIKRNMAKMGEGGVVHHWDLPYDVWSVFTVFELII